MSRTRDTCYAVVELSVISSLSLSIAPSRASQQVFEDSTIEGQQISRARKKMMIGLLIGLTHILEYPINVLRIIWNVVVNAIAYATYPWRRLFWFFLYFYLTACNRAFMFSMKLLATPIRFLTALQREKLLEGQLDDIQKDILESVHINRELEHKLVSSERDHERIKELLKQAEQENAKSIEKIQILKIRIEELETENLTLKMQQENKIWKAVHEARTRDNNGNAKVQKQGQMTRPSVKKLPTQRMDPSPFVKKRELYGWRGAALASSLFSACLALLVGVIVWEAQEPCLPLVIALFIVVCISLKSVVHFFLCLDNRPGFDAVALLSFNWFVMGTLVFPALPKFAGVIHPVITWLAEGLIRPFGLHLHG